MRQIRRVRGTEIPSAWYRRPYLYQLAVPQRKMKDSGDIIQVPRHILQPDYEFEIAMWATKPIQTDDITIAIKYVTEEAWFSILNDMSARDLQYSDMELPLSVAPSNGVLGKSFGSRWIHASKLNFDANGVPDIPMRLFHNDCLRSEGNFSSIYFTDPTDGAKKCWSFAQVIAWLGKYDQGLETGMVLGSGTIGDGSIAEFRKPPTGTPCSWPIYPWLQDGDIIRMEADFGNDVNLTLENTIAIV